MKSTAQAAPVLSLVDVCLRFEHSRSLLRSNDIEVLRGIDMVLHAGRTIGILGRNGAGKSSLLKIMAGVLQPDSGKVIHHRPDLKISLQSMALGFQPNLSGRENAVLGCLLMGLSRDQIDELIPEIIAFAGLSHCIDEALTTYSTGMRARLGFSVAYHTRADIMLIDEALGVGDHEFKLKSRNAMLEAISSDSTAVLVSHDEHFLSEHCDELLWLENGQLIMQDSPEEVLAYYHDYDHLVLQLAADIGTTVEEVRSHPDSQDPREHLLRVRGNLKAQRSREREQLGQGPVNFYYPSRRETLSQIIMEECGSTTWIEKTHELARGDDHQVRGLYLAYEGLLYSMARETGTNQKKMQRSALSQQLVEFLVRKQDLTS